MPLPLLQVREAGEAALATYDPQFYPGKIVFLKAAERSPDFPDDPERIWRRLVASLRIQTVPGAHLSMVSRHANCLASRLAFCLADPWF